MEVWPTTAAWEVVFRLCLGSPLIDGRTPGFDNGYVVLNVPMGGVNHTARCFSQVVRRRSMHPSEVILVEDNAGDALLIGQALAECPLSVHLHIARDGEQALQMLRESDLKPDLVILDLNLPKISGYVVLASYPLEHTPVVVFTASQNEVDRDRAFSLGASGFVRKPMELDEYRHAVCGMIQKWVAFDDGDGAA